MRTNGTASSTPCAGRVWKTCASRMSSRIGLQGIEYCEIFAREAGFHARVFDNEATAELWLRYGSQAEHGDGP